ncbi:MAG: NrdH-redoxin [Chloroflexota bacterium]
MTDAPRPSSTLTVRTGLKAGKLTVYGTESCPWTVKQIEYLKQKGKPYTFVNCETGQCPDFVQGFPTMDLDGKIIVGFNKI